MTKERRLQALQRQVDRLDRRLFMLERLNSRYTWIRLVEFTAGVAIGGLLFFLVDARLLWIALLGTMILFAIIVALHRRVEQSIASHTVLRALKQSHIARMSLDWDQLAVSQGLPEHPLELDFDLVGERSLHRLVDTAVSEGGSRRLREWLVGGNHDPQATHVRQKIVRELAPLFLFRDRLTVTGTVFRGEGQPWRSDRLLAWLVDHSLPGSIRQWLIFLTLLATLNVTLFLLYIVDLIPPWWLGSTVLYAAVFLVKSRSLGDPFKESLYLRDVLEQLLSVFRRLEAYSFSRTPGLMALCAPFVDPERKPSTELTRLNRVVNATGIRGNPVFWLILNAVFPWDYYFAYKLSQSKERLANQLPVWLEVWFELEALSSLANLAYLNPSYTFPEIDQPDREKGEPVFQAMDLGHPLIPDTVRVCNDFSIDSIGGVDIFTGSNMSGKSTFLRTVGINLILAYAGGPVNASFLRTVPFRLHSCIRISDSVTDGISYFYAEVKCLKSLLETLESEQTPTQTMPLLYFIDEIFRGTNNRERLLGSRAYIKALAGKPGAGLVATHDLELVNLSEEIPGVRNYHFTDAVAEGRMVFDYRLHEGPSPTTNALKIMRLEGLPI